MYRRNLPEDLKLQTFFGQLLCIIIIPIPKSKELKTKKPEKICLAVVQQVYANFPNAHGIPLILFYLQTGGLDPVDINTIQCIVSRKTGGNGGWSTAVARWHTQYSTRWTNLQQHNQASELCTNALALRVALCLSVLVHVVSCIVWYAVHIIWYIERLCTYILNDTPTFLHLTMPAFFPLFFFFFIPGTAFIVHHG